MGLGLCGEGRGVCLCVCCVVQEREERGLEIGGAGAAWGNEPTLASIGGGSGVDHTRARREIKPAYNRAHASVDGCSEDRQVSSAMFSENVNCVQNFVNTKLVEEI